MSTTRRPLLVLFLFSTALALSAQTMVVRPYVQPGDGSALGERDVKVIAWMTDLVAADFHVEFEAAAQPVQTVAATRTALRIGGKDAYFLYAADLSGLPLDASIHYRVLNDREVIADNSFTTRKSPEKPIHFVVTGDMASGEADKYAVAHQIGAQHPEFLLLCGDITYERGRVSEYLKKFWPVYDGAATDSPPGETIMQSVVFYPAMGNHDAELDDLGKLPDAFAAYYFFHPPHNAPATGSWRPYIPGSDAQVRDFEAAAATAGFPHLSLYSWDNGPAHFLALDSNTYMPLLSADYRAWIRRDLMNSHARWKIVFFHEPGFQSAASHYNQQKMRLLAPLFEEAGVDVVFAGHVHNYQRSKPLHFAPKDALPELGFPVRGKFTLDETFDGAKHTEPKGVIYIVTGGGGAPLYPMMPHKAPGKMMADPDTSVPFIAKFLADRHSLSVVDIAPAALRLRQIDDQGAEVDHITITKPAR